MIDLANALVTLGVLMVFFVVIAAIVEAFIWMKDNY